MLASRGGRYPEQKATETILTAQLYTFGLIQVKNQHTLFVKHIDTDYNTIH